MKPSYGDVLYTPSPPQGCVLVVVDGSTIGYKTHSFKHTHTNKHTATLLVIGHSQKVYHWKNIVHYYNGGLIGTNQIGPLRVTPNEKKERNWNRPLYDCVSRLPLSTCHLARVYELHCTIVRENRSFANPLFVCHRVWSRFPVRMALISRTNINPTFIHSLTHIHEHVKPCLVQCHSINLTDPQCAVANKP